MEAPRIVFLHVAKAGGTTLHSLLTQRYSADQIWPQDDRHLERASPEALQHHRLFSAHFDMARCRTVPDPKLLVTVLREPKGRLLSLYYFWKAHRSFPDTPHFAAPRAAIKMDLLSFLRCEEPNVRRSIVNRVTRLFGGGDWDSMTVATLDRAKAALEEFHAVGIFEDYERSINTMFRRLNLVPPGTIPRLNVAKDIGRDDPVLRQVEREPISLEIMAELNRLTHFDRELYDFACVLSSQQAASESRIARPAG